MYKAILLAVATLAASPSAYACEAWANGVTSTDLKPLLEEIEVRLKKENDGKLPREIKGVLWESVTTDVGTLGDCSAVSVDAKVNLIANDTNFCKLSMNVRYVKSDSEFLSFYEQSNENLECLPF